jgi:putative addiction module component (TIGR02574 family)
LTHTAQQLKPSLAQLSLQDRAELAEYLIESLDEQTDTDAETKWDVELARRAKDINNGAAVGDPADKVLSRLREKYS